MGIILKKPFAETDLLEKVKSKPGMYIGRPAVSDLFMFLLVHEGGLGLYSCDFHSTVLI